MKPPSPAEYWVGPVIGEGSFSQVHIAREKVSNRRVAIKVVEQVLFQRNPNVLPCILQEQKLLERMQREASSQNRDGEHQVGPDWVIGLWCSFYDSQCLYLVLEICEGGDLHGWIRKEFQEQKAGDAKSYLSSISFFAVQICCAVDWLHETQGILHCDLKPGNILLTSQGRVKLADFGSALDLRSATTEWKRRFSDSPRGTLEFSSPEIVRADSSGLTTATIHAIDYWSVGCIFFAMFTGESPFHREDGSVPLIVKSITEHASMSLGEIRLLWRGSGISEEWLEQIQNLLQPSMQDRHRSWTGANKMLFGEKLQNKDMELVIANWKAPVETDRWRDGQNGWTAFLM